MRNELRDHIRDGLLARGYVAEGAVDSPEAMGSWYEDYVRRDRRIRLVWDGRDEWFVMQGGIPWRDLAVQRPGALAGGGLDDFLAHAE